MNWGAKLTEYEQIYLRMFWTCGQEGGGIVAANCLTKTSWNVGLRISVKRIFKTYLAIPLNSLCATSPGNASGMQSVSKIVEIGEG